MTSTAYEKIRDAIQAQGGTVTERSHGDCMAQCPAHDDGRPSLHLSIGKTADRAVLNCFADCTDTEVLAALNLTVKDLFDESTTYQYAGGAEVHRDTGKRFWQNGNKKDRNLFRVERLPDDRTIPVLVVEGEKDANSASYLDGVFAVSPRQGSSTDPSRYDWSPLKGRPVIVVADSDDQGIAHARRVADLLTNVAESVKVVQAAEGKDFTDHVQNGHTVAELVAVTLDATETPTSQKAEPEQKPERRSVAAQLVDLAQEHYELGMSDDEEPFGARKSARHIAMMLRGGRTGLRAELARRHFEATSQVAAQQALADACNVLEGIAAQCDPTRLFLRVAEHGDAAYLDVGDTAGHVVRIQGGTWGVVDTAPVVFARTKLTAAHPLPERGGDLAELWEFVRVAEQDRSVLLAVLIQALIQTDVPHPVLALLAEQGSAKSSTTRLLVDLVDPTPVPLRQAPHDADSWVTAAAGSWVVALDNLSGLPAWLSDSLCRASTGDGNVKRALYSDAGLAVVKFRRVVIINGIDIGAMRGDLAERLVSVDLARIPRHARRNESELNLAWSKSRGRVFGALLDLAAEVHGMLPSVRLDESPRMADFARVLAAVDKVLDTEGFARYLDQQDRLAEDSLSADDLIARLRSERYKAIDRTSTELLADLTPAEGKPPRDWPKNGRAVTTLLRRHAPALRSLGWVVADDGGRNHRNSLQWTITPPAEDRRNSHSQDSQDSQQAADQYKQRESERESAASQRVGRNSQDSRASYRESEQNPDSRPDSHYIADKPAGQTGSCESASVASQNPGLSLATTPETSPFARRRREPDPECRVCGEPLKYDDDRSAGYHTARAKCLELARKELHA